MTKKPTELQRGKVKDIAAFSEVFLFDLQLPKAQIVSEIQEFSSMPGWSELAAACVQQLPACTVKTHEAVQHYDTIRMFLIIIIKFEPV